MLSGGSATRVIWSVSSWLRPSASNQVSSTASALAPRVLTAIFLPIRSSAVLIFESSATTTDEVMSPFEPYEETTALMGAPVATSWAVAPKNALAAMSTWSLTSACSASGPAGDVALLDELDVGQVTQGVGELEDVDRARVGLVADLRPAVAVSVGGRL